MFEQCRRRWNNIGKTSRRKCQRCSYLILNGKASCWAFFHKESSLSWFIVGSVDVIGVETTTNQRSLPARLLLNCSVQNNALVTRATLTTSSCQNTSNRWMESCYLSCKSNNYKKSKILTKTLPICIYQCL